MLLLHRLAVALGLLSLLAGCQRTPSLVNFVAEGKPATLAEWHVVESDGKRLSLNAGVLPYDLNTPLFSDHAHKLRTVWMPAGQAAAYHEQEAFDFPVGTILSKTFYYPKVDGASAASGQVRQTAATLATSPSLGLDLSQVRLIETRLLVRRADGWVALPYVWNDAQTEAVLERTGDQKALELVDTAGHHQRFAYVVPDENQCASCHVVNLKSKVFTPIGPKARHLNRTMAYAEGEENQLARWQRAGFLTGLPNANDLSTLPRTANWADVKLPLADRARAYLDVNCAHCHQANATASNTALRLDAFAPVDWQMGLCKPPVAAGKGTGDRLFGIVPGQPDASIMAWRMASTEGGVMMPELGRNTVHEEGLRLVRQWIASLPGHCRPPEPNKL
ncbi:MAG TPA: SO2930 family diheme c-type cytochrome [Ideonella sp.]|uniref:SO2930 family diheme c-type cytochrome n=1 Tax=Ideonella sp. TaxID=1929293 RepID=UPI002E307F2C|nr:SO2930 family diheme c-type cytochrome [Ideonella sp.]HEX5685366.1 SO2930 family diheme c-type cytochrome [Ideonella sp.]